MNKSSLILLTGGLLVGLGTGSAVAESKIYIPSDETRIATGEQNLTWHDIAKRYAPSTGRDDWRKVITKGHWQDDHSAKQTATAWESANPNLPPEIANLFYGDVELLAATPEHKTRLPGGHAPGKTDVFAFVRINDRVCAVAVEGKKNEVFDKTIGKWLEGASAGKLTRLKSISETLGLPYPPADHIRYQLLQRSAIAVSDARRFDADCAAMVVQSFSSQQKWLTDYEEFLGLFGIRTVTADKLYKTERPGMTLYLGWASAVPVKVTSTEVVTAKNDTGEKNWWDFSGASVTAFFMFALGAIVALWLVVCYIWRATKNQKSSSETSLTEKQQEAANEINNLIKMAIADGVLTPNEKKLIQDKCQQAGVDVDRVFKRIQIELDKMNILGKSSETKIIDINEENGYKFEKHVVCRFPRKYYSVLDWAGDKFVDGIYAQTTMEPDLKLKLKVKGRNYQFAVECKWRKSFNRDSITFAKESQLKNYQEYEKKTGQKTFIALGVGEPADDPESIFVIPVSGLTATTLTKKQLVRYYKGDKKGNFYYHGEEKYLDILPR